MTNPRYPRLTVRLSGDLVGRLDTVANARDVSKSKLIRQALIQFLTKLEVHDDLGRLSNNS
jgi:predicted transcriptional regulator